MKHTISEIVTRLQNYQIEILADVNDSKLLAKILSQAFPNDKPSFAFKATLRNTYYSVRSRHILNPPYSIGHSWSRLDPESDESKKKYLSNLKKSAIPGFNNRSIIVPPGFVSLSNILK